MRDAGGIALLSIGALGLVLPFLPGVPLLLAATAVLGHDHPLVRPMARLRSWRTGRRG
ncbi:MAG TPA: hypothetical protein VFC42_16985 [Methylomirabilota bacterium]|nr:hypothetical protein [Methylomirabilota bacterium]